MGWIIGAVLLAVAAVFMIALFAVSRHHRRLAVEQQSAKLIERVEQFLELADIWLEISDRDEIAVELLRLGQESLDNILALTPHSGYAMQRQQDVSETFAGIESGDRREPTTILGSAASVPRLVQQLKTIKRILRIRQQAGFLEAESFESYAVEIEALGTRCALDTYIHFGERAMETDDAATARKRFRQALETIRKADVLDKTIESYFKRVTAMNNQLGPTATTDTSDSGRRSDPA